MSVCRKCGAPLNARSHCLPCGRIYDAKRRTANPKRAREATVRWQKKNPDKMRAAVTRWQAENPKKRMDANAAWLAKHPEAPRIFSLNRLARKKANGGKLSLGLAQKLFALQRGKCPCCGKPLGDDYHLDHKMPLALGGANEDWNMQLLRQRCNTQKQAKHPVDFMQSRGFLL